MLVALLHHKWGLQLSRKPLIFGYINFTVFL